MVKIHSVSLDDKMYSCGYKVVTQDMKSLGLRNNPNIMTFPINEWCVLPSAEVESGEEDYGGIWLARTPGGARGLMRYMLNPKKRNTQTRVFKTAIQDVLHANDYRIKTNAVYLMEEYFDFLK